MFGLLASWAGAAKADDPTIPSRCRSEAARDDDKCSDILTARFLDRNARLNKRDKLANAEMKARILASWTISGGTVATTLDYASHHILFAVTAWDFVYGRSGSEYVVASYAAKPDTEKQSPRDRQLQNALLFDYHLDVDPVTSLQNSQASGLLVWKVEGSAFHPWGSYANMVSLTPGAFVHAVNAGRKGFDSSGYDPAVDADLSFVSGFGDDVVRTAAKTRASAPGPSFYWNSRDGFTIRSDQGPCPVQMVGIFKLRGHDCESRAAAAKVISGAVLPFKVIGAVRNHGFDGGMVEADVSLSVEGGGPGDWMATAVYVAEHAIVGDVTFADVSVFVPNPWGDLPPQGSKTLAKVYYAPNPAKSPYKEPWLIMGAAKAGTLADVEYDKLSNDLIEDPAKVPYPERRMSRAEAAAKALVIRKYGLPSRWTPAERLGLDSQPHDRTHIQITHAADIGPSMIALEECLSTERGNALFRGCMPQRP